MQFIIYMDESGKEGPFFGNFYGGALVRSTDLNYVKEVLETKKHELNLMKEIKWQRVTPQYLDKYLELMATFFDLIQEDKVKIRIMFTQNVYQPINLNSTQLSNTYQLLYYQFFKHAFGLQYCNPNVEEDVSLRLYFDELPVNNENKEILKQHIFKLQGMDIFAKSNIKIKREDITEVKSDQHAILQYMDVVLGSMYFRLNDLHKAKPEGSRIRGKRTVAKEQLYKYINRRIRAIYPGFNIGKSTGVSNIMDRWNHSYRHWLFIPQEHQLSLELSKKKRENPVSPT